MGSDWKFDLKVICRKHFACFSDGPSASYSGDYRHTTRSFYMYSYIRCTPADHSIFFLVSTDAARDRTVPKIEGCRKKKRINPLRRRGKRNFPRLVHTYRSGFLARVPKISQCLLVLSTLPGKSKRSCHIGNLMRNVGGPFQSL